MTLVTQNMRQMKNILIELRYNGKVIMSKYKKMRESYGNADCNIKKR